MVLHCDRVETIVESSGKPDGSRAWKEEKLEQVLSCLTWAHNLRYLVAEKNELSINYSKLSCILM